MIVKQLQKKATKKTKIMLEKKKIIISLKKEILYLALPKNTLELRFQTLKNGMELAVAN